MYTIGQVAKFLGMTRDTLKFYEEKELVKPKQDDTNGYRKYNHFDIYDVVTINFYREIDIEIKKIQDIRRSKSIEELAYLLEEKEQQVLEEIAYKNLLLKRIQHVKADCQKVKQYLGKYMIKEMQPLKVTGEITDLAAHDEYDILQNNPDNLKQAVTLTGLRRVIKFNAEGIIGDRFIIVRKVEDINDDIEGEVLTYPKCIYTIIENGRWSTNGKNMDDQVEESLRRVASQKGYELLGLVFVNMIITTYEEGLERVFLEIYSPIK
ncbi:MerR family transcriptional regulator [Paenibacillus yanchengensis]|uniref:MerR family transcriptional regulator n=1 Tax=Paenibacillus yanchengensis TaxID=2035833 RepID=A0ABW4YPP9_9BACL